MMNNAQEYEAWDIRLENLTVGYDESVVLRDVSAVLPAGKISVILGGSGCGKSTLLKHILGLMRPFEGAIYMGGESLFSLGRREFRRIRRRIGVLFQDGALLGSLTLGENIALPLKEHTTLSKQEIQDVVLLKLSLVGLKDYVDYYPSQLSGGMRKRAGLARAICMDPPILLCDEPTSGLDPINSAQMDRLLKEMNRLYHVTVVVVSHDLESMKSLADNVVVLNEGTVVFQGGREALSQTDDAFLQQFLQREPGEESMPEVGATHALLTRSLKDA